jgi:hypothetical protein
MEFSFSNIAILSVAVIVTILLFFAIFWEKLYHLSRKIYHYAAYAYGLLMISMISIVIYKENKDSINQAIHFVVDKMLFVSAISFFIFGIFGTCHLLYKFSPEAKDSDMKEKRDKALLIIGIALGICNFAISMIIFEIYPLDEFLNKIDRLSRESGFADGYSVNLMAAVSCWTAIPFLYGILRRYLASRNGAGAVISADD